MLCGVVGQTTTQWPLHWSISIISNDNWSALNVCYNLVITLTLCFVCFAGCQYEGRSYKEGQDIRLADPCVKCNCVRGSLVCRLRVCAPQPHPPPPGCWLLRRRNDCCHKLICSRGKRPSLSLPIDSRFKKNNVSVTKIDGILQAKDKNNLKYEKSCRNKRITVL